MLTFTNVSFHYPGSSKTVIQNASIDLEPGHIYGLLGKNGVGKSTLFRLMAGLNPPSVGDIKTLDFIPFERNPEMMQNIFLVPEDIMFPGMTPLKYANLYGVFYKNFSWSDFEHLLESFEVDSNAKLSSMSQGQRKKAYISFALACNTQILLMDEPTNGLDIPSKTKFRKILADHNQPERIVIISTHQVLDLSMLIDAVIILNDHQIVLCEKAETIQERYTLGMIPPEIPQDRIVYIENTVRGNVGIIKRNPEDAKQTLEQFDLETLFNAVTEGHAALF